MGVRIAGHTMGTPELTPAAAIDLFARLELDGVELICTDGYQCGVALQTPEGELQALRRRAADQGLAIAGLVPYMKDMNSADGAARRRSIAEAKGAVDIAVKLGCPAVRILAGHEVPAAERDAALRRLAEALREIGEHARPAGVRLAIENHMDTMATSAAATMEIVRAVDLPNVGVLYDQGNLTHLGQEEYGPAIDLQWPHIHHVHAKDMLWLGSERRAAVMGDGIVPWPQIVRRLTALGYDGYYSLEYERRWSPDQLPPAEVGMRRGAELLRGEVI